MSFYARARRRLPFSREAAFYPRWAQHGAVKDTTMSRMVQGLHHVTSLANGARSSDEFHVGTLGLRRVKKTLNFDAPNVYHLYYGDELGRPGTVTTLFPFAGSSRGKHGSGETGAACFSAPEGALAWWKERLANRGVANANETALFGEKRLGFYGPDGEELVLVERDDDRERWKGGGVGGDEAIRGLHSVSLRLEDAGATIELLKFMGYEEGGVDGDISRLVVPGGNGADAIDLETVSGAQRAQQGAGTVHHVAFSVESAERQREVRDALAGVGRDVTPLIDRDYFQAICFMTPGGVLFEVATDGPGFDRDEDAAHLGETLKLPARHAHLREKLEKEHLEPID